MTQMPVVAVPVSVVIVSRGRPDALTICLTGVAQMSYPAFEVVVVADPGGIAAAAALPFAEALKLVPFDEANISAARNLGITHAAGELIAFLDDDSVPEPTWLHHLAAPASQPQVAAIGGFVRARNGISLQWGAQGLDVYGRTAALNVDAAKATILTPTTARAIKTEGTNMAVRRDVLVDLGGFDPAYHYYLDETDLNLRLAHARLATAVVPLAQVHHGYAANRMRTGARVPKDLFDIGASWAVFQRKHVPKQEHSDHWRDICVAERARLLRHLVGGTLEPRDLRRLMRRLKQGHAEGVKRPLGKGQIARHPSAPFQAMPQPERRDHILSGRIWSRGRLTAQAAALVAAGNRVTVLLLSPTALFHRAGFRQGGYWMQTGGRFGRSDRSDPLFRCYSQSGRIRRECARLQNIRAFRFRDIV